MAGWGKLVVGALLGAAGTVYATNEEVRKKLPKAAQDLPDTVRRRFERAVSAAREGASSRRAEILRDLEEHGGGDHEERGVQADPTHEPREAGRPAEPYKAGDTERLNEFFAGNEDETGSFSRAEKG